MNRSNAPEQETPGQVAVSQKKELSCRLKCLWLNFFCKFLHFDLVGKNYFTIFAGGKGKLKN